VTPDPRLTMLALALALASCGETKKAASAGTAGGEVLPGSASDAMLPIDAVRSQPPLAPKVQPSGAKGAKPGAAGKPPAADVAAEVEAPAAADPAPEAPADQ
jgi:hypothetical protein